MNPYRAADGRWFFFTGLEAARHIPAVCRALGRPDLLDDPRFADARPSAATAPRSSPCSTRSSPQRPLAEWAERFEAEGVWWAPAQTPAEVVADPQLAANDGFVDLEGGALRSVNGPVTFSGLPATQGGARARRSASTPTRCWPSWPARASDTAGAGPAP